MWMEMTYYAHELEHELEHELPMNWNISFIIWNLVVLLPTGFPSAGRPWIKSVMGVLSIFYLASELPDAIGLVRVMELKLFL